MSLALIVTCLGAGVVPAAADVAPPHSPVASGIEPGDEQTQVRMMYENVFMEIDLDGVARVDANFVMRNLGDKEERMDVFFPLFTDGTDIPLSTGPHTGCFAPGKGHPISDLSVWVWDKPQPTRNVIGRFIEPWPRDFSNTPTPLPLEGPCWAAFPVVFPPGLDVPIEVKYTSPSYTYILETGAGWKGTIGQADITFRLQYDAVKDQNLDRCWPECKTQGRDILWQFMDFEPDFNIGIKIVQPSIWWRILTESSQLKLNPKDGAAWRKLALAYQDSVEIQKHGMIDGARGSLWRYDRGVEAFRNAVTYNPNDADLHAHFADFTCRYASFPMRSIEERVSYPDWIECAQQIQAALQIDPQNQLAASLFDNYAKYPGSGQPSVFFKNGDKRDFWVLTGTPTDFPTFTPPPPGATPMPTASLTATPTATVTPTLTLTPSPRPSATPTATLTATPAPFGGDAGALWGWILIPVVIILAGAVVLRRRAG